MGWQYPLSEFCPKQKKAVCVNWVQLSLWALWQSIVVTAFNVGLSRAYTTRKVTNHQSYISKCDFFNTSYTPDLQPHANFIPGFKFLELPGATLNAIGILNSNAQAQHAQEIQTSETLFATQFFLQVLNPCMEGLPLQTKTRVNNLVKTASKMQIYWLTTEYTGKTHQPCHQQLNQCSCRTTLILYLKFGQQQPVTSVPITLRSTNLDLVIADPSRPLGVSVHLVINFDHRDPRYSVFWSTQPTAGYLQGQSTKKFPLLGLFEVGNTTCTFPRADNFMQAINRWGRGAIRFTYAQVYTPFTKALENSSQSSQRPFLPTLLLRKAFVSRTTDMSHVQHCTEELYEYFQLVEASLLNLYKVGAGAQLSSSWSSLLTQFHNHCYPSKVWQPPHTLLQYLYTIHHSLLYLQVPCADMRDYAKNLFWELITPLRAALEGTLSGPFMIPTVLLCETLLAFLPSMSTRGQSYEILKDYKIARGSKWLAYPLSWKEGRICC